MKYSSTIRSVNCSLLVKGSRCSYCANDRRMLRKRHQRSEERKKSPPVNYVHHQYQYKNMRRENLLTKIAQQNTEMKAMSSEIEKLKRKCQRQIIQDGVSFDENHNLEL